MIYLYALISAAVTAGLFLLTSWLFAESEWWFDFDDWKEVLFRALAIVCAFVTLVVLAVTVVIVIKVVANLLTICGIVEVT